MRCSVVFGIRTSLQSCTTLDPTRGSGRVGSGRVGSENLQERAGRVGSGRVHFGQRPKFNFKVP